LQRIVVLIESEGKILVKKGEAGKVMADLYEFPYFDLSSDVDQTLLNWGLRVTPFEKLKSVTHTFTHFKAKLHPVRCKADVAKPISGYHWVSVATLHQLPFSSGHRKILSL
jgi:A/G-specific adenine glycosylase